MNVIAAHLRLPAVSIFPYLDDWLIRDLILNQLISHTKYNLQTVQNLGFIPNLKKSDLIPTQKFTFIGMEFLTQQKIVRVPANRVKALILAIKTILSQTQISVRTFLSLLGKLSAAADLILLGRLHLQPLQMCLLSVWKPHILPLDDQVTINSIIKFHLKWWMNTNRFVQRMPIHPPDSKTFLYTDASHYGWGAHLEPMSLSFHGRWSEDQSQLHINMLEIMAIRFALIKALKYIRHSCVMISTNNTTVVSYINKQGGTHSPNLRVEVWKILQWCLNYHIVVRIRHIPGKFNVLADMLSRIDKIIKTEWALDKSMVNSIFQMFSYPNLDLFATRFNHKLPLYVSPVLDNQAFVIDAFSLNWNSLHAYAFPPTILIPSVLNKIRQSQCRIVLIAPLWPQQTWVLRGSTSTCLSSSLSSTLSKSINTSKRKVSTSKPPSTQPSCLGVIKQSVRDRKFLQNVADFVSKSRRTSSQKVMTWNGAYIPVGVIEGRLIRSRPLILL